MTEHAKYDIGKRIRDCRIKKGMTQAQFAESIDISINFLSEVENGKKGLSYETLYHLCESHSISADYILFGVEPEKINSADIAEMAFELNNDELTTLVECLTALLKLRKE
jgi:transcriptional regulator with XRE-family HTH domain